MNPEILRFGRINAAARTKATSTMPLERNLSFIALLPCKSAVRIFSLSRLSTRRDRFHSRAVDKRGQPAAAVPDSLLVFPGGVHVERASISHFNDSLSGAFARTGVVFLPGGNRALV